MFEPLSLQYFIMAMLTDKDRAHGVAPGQEKTIEGVLRQGMLD